MLCKLCPFHNVDLTLLTSAVNDDVTESVAATAILLYTTDAPLQACAHVGVCSFATPGCCDLAVVTKLAGCCHEHVTATDARICQITY